MADTCIGCGRASDKQGFQIIAVINKADTPALPTDPPNAGSFVHRPVCDNCHRDPAHRKTLIKGHFFETAYALRAVAMAGSTEIKG